MLAQIDWWQHINGYCERNDATFWAEPLNAWSNAAFWLAAALFAWVLHRRVPGVSASPLSKSLPGSAVRDLWVLNMLLVGIGVGSFCFHTFAVRWSAMLDVGFIVLWVYAYLLTSAWRVLRWRAWQVALGLLAHLSLSPLLGVVFERFLFAYAPTALAAYLLAWHAHALKLPGAKALLGSAVIFTLSMAMAGLDAPLCGYVPTGTHFLWHLFNAASLLFASVGLARNLKARTTPVGPPL